MPLTFVFRNGASLDAIPLDASLQEKHAGTVEIPKHPVETGAQISDHVVPQPADLQIDGVITDYPLSDSRGTFRAPEAVSPQPAAEGRASALYGRLEELRDAGSLIEVVTSAKRYSDMAIVSLGRTRDKASSDGAIKFSASLQAVRTVATQTVPIKPTKVSIAKGKASGGKQTGKEADGATKSKSWLAAGVDGIVGRDGVGGPSSRLPGALKNMPVR